MLKVGLLNEVRWLTEDDLPDGIGGGRGEHTTDINRDILTREVGFWKTGRLEELSTQELKDV